MLIRENGQRVTLLRAESTRTQTPAAPAKRGRPRKHTVIGAFRATDGVPEEILRSLAAAERKVLDRWMAAFRESQARVAAAPVLASAQLRLDELVSALDAAADTLTSTEADALWERLQAVKQSLRRAGHTRPATKKRPPAPAGQRDLVDELHAWKDAR
ncbi:hypothetical protein NFI99_12780 (plasmid) [Burkholderia glumae]|uniref:Uncharacterized protein n=1 Tax=Burkholderia glumae TaxID=337 RepID=A0ABY5BCA7_BURGL|nr:hypothetical protein [Burkholderia glumae]MCM2547235.1 hypothetical protein [Burkholderia glumae]USS44155.1 hypothetical protein NFI99_12780 [Burkholderia glumae]